MLVLQLPVLVVMFRVSQMVPPVVMLLLLDLTVVLEMLLVLLMHSANGTTLPSFRAPRPITDDDGVSNGAVVTIVGPTTPRAPSHDPSVMNGAGGATLAPSTTPRDPSDDPSSNRNG